MFNSVTERPPHRTSALRAKSSSGRIEMTEDENFVHVCHREICHREIIVNQEASDTPSSRGKPDYVCPKNKYSVGFDMALAIRN